MIETLNEQLGIANRIEFVAGSGGLPKAVLHAAHADADVYLHGATITSYRLHGGREVLWLSDRSHFEADRPIRGGVPICWPWFGQPDPQKPQHGFARTSDWIPVHTEQSDDGRLILRLQLTDSEQTRRWWPHRFELTFQVCLGTRLEFCLTCRNLDTQAFTVETALHSYLRVGSAAALRIDGLSDCEYIDKVDQMIVKRQQGSILIDSEVDRIYVPTESEVTVFENDRPTTKISKSGSRSTVVWNPWIAKSKAMDDFPDDGYQSMVCIETANAAHDARTIDGGQCSEISQTICPLPDVP